ncbi:MAG: phosphonate ABC transporter, permease protein PhnE [Betaproteobacteria bacterium]|nr:phosphonate ABC transporter, permease protein PhnE [Betaproteobacteria bacterium]
MDSRPDANTTAPPLPPALFDARCRACWMVAGLVLLTIASFWSLDLDFAALFSADSRQSMLRFVSEFFPPDFSAPFMKKVAIGTLETLAMSLLGTVIAAVWGLLLALPAARTHAGDAALARTPTRLVLNALRSIPELVWAALLLISAGLGPFAGTLALAFHTTGVLGRLFAEAIENADPAPAFALRAQGVGPVRVFLYTTLPQILPQVMSYSLYRWENNIRAAAVLGVVGAGGLGQLLAFHMGLFHMGKTATILMAMIALVALVDIASYLARRWMTR